MDSTSFLNPYFIVANESIPTTVKGFAFERSVSRYTTEGITKLLTD